MGGHHFRSDAYFTAAALGEVRQLAVHGLKRDSRLLDWGCGAGRLAVGVREHFGRLDLYHGVDVQRHLIDWACRYLAGDGYRFTHVDAANDRYNARGGGTHHIPGYESDYDVLYAYSVFSHMHTADVAAYLTEISRILRRDGFGFFTAFVEKGVERESENPDGYGPMQWNGPLHCIRFNREFFEEMIEQAGMRVEHFEHGTETDGQSLYVTRLA